MEDALRALWPSIRRALPWLVAGGAGLGLVLFGSDRIRRSVSDQQRFLIQPASLRLNRTQQIGRLEVPVTVEPVGLPEAVSAVERGMAAMLAAAFARHPWVERVRMLAIDYPKTVRVSLTLRQPVAAVRQGDVYFWVDREGVRLAGALTGRVLADSGLLFIEGVRGPVPAEGQPWADPGARAGAETALVLGEEARALGVTVVDVTNVNGRQDPRLSEIALVTARYTRILWGRPPSTDRPGELAPGDKVRQLRAAAAHGLLEAGALVDIRFPNQAIQRPPTPR